MLRTIQDFQRLIISLIPSPAGLSLGFLDLVEDILVLILGSYCDVASVIALSQTNKYLNRLAFSKTVWFSLVSTLVQLRFIDSQPNDDYYLKLLSTDQLVGLVKRALQGPKTWPAAEPNQTGNLSRKLMQPPSRPLVESRRIVLHPKITPSPLPSNWDYEHQTKLLPGGKYLLFQNYDRLECWSVFDDRLVWAHGVHKDSMVLDFDAEWDGDERLVIVVHEHARSASKALVEVLTLDLKSESSGRVLSTRISSTGRDPYMSCTIRGDFVAVDLWCNCWPHPVLLINWRARSRVVVSNPGTAAENPHSPSPYQITLTTEHLVLTTSGRLALSSLSSLFPFLEPITDKDIEPSSHISVTDIFLPDTHTIPLQGHPADTCRSTWVFESPLRRGLFRVWIHAVHDGLSRVSGYEYSIRNTQLSWRSLASSYMLEQKVSPRAMTLSGHTVAYANLLGVPLGLFAPAAAEGTASLHDFGIKRHFLPFSMSPFSGTLTYCSGLELVVVYYD
ncbi:hypothetical protein B0H16DRAFT_1595477 [Mycena metata]|uniref:F-box domain-containing protein n=1 Tax=Mycena metata TaxID=1033252 RepID=A0AAD7MN90_9AGAR|nr:hypothetical protein B0H16DRAFT_1595477 [Mycena metata]